MFDLLFFKSLPFIAARKYLYSFIKIGSGSGRNVFSIGNGLVIKWAKNNKGILQNKEEARVSGKYSILAKIHEHAPDFQWLVVEELSKFSFSSFKLKYGITFSLFCKVLELVDSCQLSINAPIYYSQFKNWNLLKKLVIVEDCFKLILDENHCWGDIARYCNWRMRGNEFVLADYGLTWGLYRKHYQ